VIDTDLDLDAGRLPSQSISHTEAFVDPIVGASFNYQLAPDWSVAVSGSVGGFGVAADLEWSMTGGVTHHAGKTWGVVLGYRYLAIDYSDDGFVYDVAQHGPLLGVVFDF
jgi:hypothetical protein